jgi:non-ribosomal peptide synthetase component F
VRNFRHHGERQTSNHAPFNFDLSVFDIFVAVKAGAAISLVPEGLAVFPLQLSSFIQDQKITVWYSVPMVLALLPARGRLEERDLAALRRSDAGDSEGKSHEIIQRDWAMRKIQLAPFSTPATNRH